MALLFCLPCPAQTATNQPAPATYDDHLQRARALLKENKFPEALTEAQAAAKLDPKGYEAPAAAALIFHAANKPAQAKAAIADALKLAPADKRQEVEEIAKLVGATLEATPATAPTATAAAPPAKLTGPARRQMDALLLIIEDADKAKLADERKKLLREFLDKSEPFVKEHPDQLSIWTLRAVGAMELNQVRAGWEAGQQMIKLGADNSDDAKVRKVMAILDRKGWLMSSPIEKEDQKEGIAAVTHQKPAANSKEAAAAAGELAANYHYGKNGCARNDAEAVKWFRAAVNGCGNPAWLRALAEILATSPDDGVRNGKEAVEYGRLALKECSLYGDPRSEYYQEQIQIMMPSLILDRSVTLAAAYAEAGDFENAMKTLQEAIQAQPKDERKSCSKVLAPLIKRYKDRQPPERK